MEGVSQLQFQRIQEILLFSLGNSSWVITLALSVPAHLQPCASALVLFYQHHIRCV